MPDHERLVDLPTFFTPGAFAHTRVDTAGIAYNLDLLSEADTFLQEQIGRGLPAHPGRLAFVYRFGVPGFAQPEPDPNFERTRADTAYVPADQLSLDPNLPPRHMTKGQILGFGHTVMQVQIKPNVPPSVAALAESVLFPPAEDHRMLAGPGAWVRQVKEAFSLREMPARKQRIMREAAARYSGAIVLRPRGGAEPTAS